MSSNCLTSCPKKVQKYLAVILISSFNFSISFFFYCSEIQSVSEMALQRLSHTSLVVIAFSSILLLLVLNNIQYQSSYNSRAEPKSLKNSSSVVSLDKNLNTKSHVKRTLEKAEEAYQRYISERRQIVKKPPHLIDPWPKTGRIIYFYEYFLPVFTCPYTTQRIGRIGDGGKFVCGFENFENSQNSSQKCILYSFGVNRESSFEAEFLRRTSCEIFAFDASVNSMGPEIGKHKNKSRIHFSKVFLGEKNNQAAKTKTKTLLTIMRENRHTWIDILKMDIEGKEFAVLNQILDDFKGIGLPFGQLQVEFHGSATGAGSFANFYKLWERLEEAGLRPFMNEVNHYMCVKKKSKPWLMEYSFINIKVDNILLH